MEFTLISIVLFLIYIIYCKPSKKIEAIVIEVPDFCNSYLKECIYDSHYHRGESPFPGNLIRSGCGKYGTNMTWVEKADKIAIYVDKGINEDMAYIVKFARKAGIKYEYRKINQGTTLSSGFIQIYENKVNQLIR